MKLDRLKALPPVIRLFLWSLVICAVSFAGLIFTKEKEEETREEAALESQQTEEEEVPYRGSNLYHYIELIEMPPETAFEKIRVLITNKEDGSIFYDMDRLDQVKADLAQENYRGELIFQQATGDATRFVVINEVPLEEYLYGVVSSEMPASYPEEALKAQAVCARTYAVLHMMNPAYPDYDAHVNDTTSFQVYHNIAEQPRTNQAVDETAGMLLFQENGEDLVETYYYSTSCGEICAASTNVAFQEYITQINEADFEAGEGWYRWSCQIQLDKTEMLKRMQERYAANKGSVLTMTGKDTYESLAIRELDRVRELFISVRGENGVGEELIISTDKNVYKVVGEYNIRYVLNRSGTEIVRQDGERVKMETLLPSAFISLEAVKSAGEVTGYQIMGGGFGHGIGMSQNGARAMAERGYTMEEILAYYYPGSRVLENLKGNF